MKISGIIGSIALCLLVACSPSISQQSEKTEAGSSIVNAVSTAENTNTDGLAQVMPQKKSNSQEKALQKLADDGEVCGPDGKLTCPLVKPVENMTIQYERTPEQIALMEAFDSLSIEEKFLALESGAIVCTEFIHDTQWEHRIDKNFIVLVGDDKFEQWMGMDDACHSIYHFANAFLLTYEDLEQVIEKNNLTNVYPLEKLKIGMEKWGTVGE